MPCGSAGGTGKTELVSNVMSTRRRLAAALGHHETGFPAALRERSPRCPDRGAVVGRSGARVY